MFYPNNLENGAKEWGIWSGKRSLTTIHRLYIKRDVTYFLESLPRLFNRYYGGESFLETKQTERKIICTIIKYNTPVYLTEIAIMYYFLGGLEILGCIVKDVKLTFSLAKGDKRTEFVYQI